MVDEERGLEMEAERPPRERILSLISEHPEGISLRELEEAAGIARIRAGNITRMLLDEGIIKKVGLLYFPAETP
jgi:DNA-binding Lrp family transcriptional regulator